MCSQFRYFEDDCVTVMLILKDHIYVEYFSLNFISSFKWKRKIAAVGMKTDEITFCAIEKDHHLKRGEVV